ncbi:MAG: HEAT repeat domain-containing protein [Verrucomicrobiota bacterium]
MFEAKSSRDAWTEKRIIAKLGEEAYPRTLEILRDTSNHERLMVLTGDENSLPEAPICWLTEIFDHDAPPLPEAADLLSPFLQSKSAEIRKSIALIIGSVGSAQSLPDLERALKDEDEYVRSYTLMGIQRAMSGGRIAPSEKPLFYALVAAMWPEDTSFNVCDSIPQILLRLDRDRAAERLLEPDLFTAQFDPVWRILQAFAEASVEIPRTRLITLIDEAGKEPIDYPMDNILEGALPLLGRHRMKKDLPTLEELVDHPNDDVSRGAIMGLYAYHR